MHIYITHTHTHTHTHMYTYRERVGERQTFAVRQSSEIDCAGEDAPLSPFAFLAHVHTLHHACVYYIHIILYYMPHRYTCPILYMHITHTHTNTHTHTHMDGTVFARANGQKPVVLVPLYTRTVATPAAVCPLLREPRAGNLTGGA